MPFLWKDNVIYDELWDIVVAAAVTSGQAAVIQDVFGFYLYNGAVGDEVTFIYRCRQVQADKVTGTGEEISAGEEVYFVIAQNAVSANPAGVIGTDYYFCGIAKKDASASEETVLINFWGDEYDHADRSA